MNLRSQAFAILFLVSLIAAGGNMALQSVLPTIGREFGLADTLVAGAFALSALLWTVASPSGPDGPTSGAASARSSWA